MKHWLYATSDDAIACDEEYPDRATRDTAKVNCPACCDMIGMHAALKRLLGENYVGMLQHAAFIILERREHLETAPKSDGYTAADVARMKDLSDGMGLLCASVTDVT